MNIEILRKGGVIAIFPAGGVAWARKKGLPVEEDDWKPMLGRLINDSKCDVLITKFGGQNSKAFQFASRIHQTFKQSLYLYEIRKSLDKPIEFEVLKYLKNETLPKLEGLKALYINLMKYNLFLLMLLCILLDTIKYVTM